MRSTKCSGWVMICNQCKAYCHEHFPFKPIELNVMAKMVESRGWGQYHRIQHDRLVIIHLCPEHKDGL